AGVAGADGAGEAGAVGGGGWAPAGEGPVTASADSAATRTRRIRRRRTVGTALDFAEDVLRDQLLDVHRRLHLGQPSARPHELLGAAGGDLDELLADQPLGLD